MNLTTTALTGRHPELWAAATWHEFLEQARDGTLAERAFARWLEQDRLFVAELARAWGALLGRAPLDDFELLAAGITAFTEELAWFEELEAARNVRLDASRSPETAAYVAYLEAVIGGPYPVAITAMWAVEAAYLQAWQRARGGSARYAEVIEHWAGEDFARFVGRLEAAADRELAASPDLHDASEAAFVAVARHEAAFWGVGGRASPSGERRRAGG